MVILWWGGAVHHRCSITLRYDPFYLQWLPLFFDLCDLWKKVLKFDHVLSLVGFWRPSLISSLNVAVLANRVIPFHTITAMVIVCLPDLENYRPFLSWPMRQERGYAGSYGPIILTTFSLRSIFSIAPNELKRFCIISRAITCTDSVRCSIIGNRKTFCTAVTVCFLIAPSMAV